MKKKYNQESVEVILDRCYFEFCEIVGDSPCGCDICPYSKYNTEEDNNGCYEAYVEDKVKQLEKRRLNNE